MFDDRTKCQHNKIYNFFDYFFFFFHLVVFNIQCFFLLLLINRSKDQN